MTDLPADTIRELQHRGLENHKLRGRCARQRAELRRLNVTLKNRPRLEGRHVYDYPRPAMTVDLVLLTENDGAPWVLLIRRGKEPFRGQWALPGGFVEPNERLSAAAARELQEETGITVEPAAFAHVGYFDRPDRDPRERVIANAFTATIDHILPKAGDDAADASWWPVSEVVKATTIAFDHLDIVLTALERHPDLKGKP